MFDLDYIDEFEFLAGCDEVGRGPLAGPVVGCCVSIERKFLTHKNLDYLFELGVTDSKKLTTKKRKNILTTLGILDVVVNQKNVHKIKEDFYITYSVRELSSTVVDELNILQASLKSMGDAFLDCDGHNRNTKVLVDGNKLLGLNLPHVEEEFVIKGDSKSIVIALASIIAKEYRDDLMIEFAKKYPHYGLERHAGYPTKAHKEAIIKYGVTPIHRKSFKGVKEYCL